MLRNELHLLICDQILADAESFMKQYDCLYLGELQSAAALISVFVDGVGAESNGENY